jgi:diamine N-acetyltransferase
MEKQHIDRVNDGLVSLRLIDKDDLPMTLTWRNRDNIRKWFFHTEPIALENHISWFNKYLHLNDDFIFIIEYDNKPVGQVSLYNIDWQNRDGEYGRLMIGEDFARGKGVSKSASMLLLDIGFHELELEKIHLEVKRDNIAAQKIYNYCGFSVSNESNDVLYMSISKNEFETKK